MDTIALIVRITMRQRTSYPKPFKAQVVQVAECLKGFFPNQRYFLNVVAVIAVVMPSITAQGTNTAMGLSEKGKDK